MKLATIRAQSEEVTEVLLYDQIGNDFFGEGVNAKTFREQLKAVKTATINLRIPAITLLFELVSHYPS